MSLLVAVVVPAVVFYGSFVVAGVWTAIAVALAWSYGAIAWRAVTGRRTSGLLVLAALLLTGRTALSVLADSPWLYFLQPVISDGAVAALFLLSLASARPMVARLAGDFYPMDRAGGPTPGPAALPAPDDHVGGSGGRQGHDDAVAPGVPVARDVPAGEERLDAGDQRAGRVRDDRVRRPRRAAGGAAGSGPRAPPVTA